MKLSIKIMGWEVASLEFEGDELPESATKPVSKPVKGISRWWVKWMVS